MRAIDGARTRGLDLGKVARYQLRHYRILTSLEISFCDVPARLSDGQVLLYNKLNLLSTIFLNFYFFISAVRPVPLLRPAACCLKGIRRSALLLQRPRILHPVHSLERVIDTVSSIVPSLTAATTPSVRLHEILRHKYHIRACLQSLYCRLIRRIIFGNGRHIHGICNYNAVITNCFLKISVMIFSFMDAGSRIPVSSDPVPKYGLPSPYPSRHQSGLERQELRRLHFFQRPVRLHRAFMGIPDVFPCPGNA